MNFNYNFISMIRTCQFHGRPSLNHCLSGPLCALISVWFSISNKHLESFAIAMFSFKNKAENWGIYTMLTELPTFMSDVMNYKIDKAGLFSALPYLVMAKVLYISGYLSDLLVVNKSWTFTHVRKLFCCAGMLLQFVFMTLAALSSSPGAIIFCSTVAIGFGGMPWSAFGVNHLDIGAGYANVLMSISNTFATLPGIISPILTGHLIEAGRSKTEWNAVFFLAAAIYALGALVFGLISKGETQPWAIRLSDLERSKFAADGSASAISTTDYPDPAASMASSTQLNRKAYADNQTFQK